MDRVEKALELREKHYSCAQAVVCSFADMLDVDEQVLFKIAEGFGFGMGAGQCVCGAVSGAVMVSSLLKSSGQPGNMESLMGSLERSRLLTEQFEKSHGGLTCKEVKSQDQERSYEICTDYVVDAVKLVEEILLKEGEKRG